MARDDRERKGTDLMGQVIPLGSSQAEERAWQQLQEKASSLRANPALFADREFYASYLVAHERYCRAYLANSRPS
jgi:hypothetical protein